tara:strand:- start:315 stop:593 length:279 start_codon:yes stop_codon:yes gene_type:complete
LTTAVATVSVMGQSTNGATIMAIADKQKADELEYYTDLDCLEVRFDEIKHDEYMDCSDESLVEQDYLDTMEFCLELENNEVIDDDQFNYMEI